MAGAETATLPASGRLDNRGREWYGEVMNTNENPDEQMLLTPREVEQVDAALAEEARAIPELRALWAANQTTLSESMSLFGDRVYAVVVKDSAGQYRWDRDVIFPDRDEATYSRDEYNYLKSDEALVVSALVGTWAVEDV